MTLFVSGSAVDPEKLLDRLGSTVERWAVAHNQARGATPRDWVRPLVQTSTADNPPYLANGDEVEVVQYPESDESVGQVQLTFLGPRANEWLVAAGLSILGDYLCGSSVSRLSTCDAATPSLT